MPPADKSVTFSASSDNPDNSGTKPKQQQKPIKKKKSRSNDQKNAVSEASPNRNPGTLTSFQPPNTFPPKKTVAADRDNTGPLPKAEDKLNELTKNFSLSEDAAQPKRTSRGPATASTQPVVAVPKGHGRILSSRLRASPTQEEPPHYTLKSSRKRRSSSEWHDLDEYSTNDNQELHDFINWMNGEDSLRNCKVSCKRSGVPGSPYIAKVSKPDTTKSGSGDMSSSGKHRADHVVSTEAHTRSPIVVREKDYIAEECGSTVAEAILNCKSDVEAYVEDQKSYLDKLKDVFSRQNS